MQYSLSTLRRKAHEAGYSFQKGYQRYNHDGWRYVRRGDGECTVGYQIFDYHTNLLVGSSYNDIHDHAMGFEEAVSLLKELCTERGVAF